MNPEPEIPVVAPKNNKKAWWIALVVALVIAAGVGVRLATKNSEDHSYTASDADRGRQAQSPPPQQSSSTPTNAAMQGGNKANAEGLVNAKSLECLPRGHDNYRTNSTLAVDPTNADIAYVGIEYKGIYKTIDGGGTWTKSDFGVRGYPMESDATKKCVQELGRTIIDPQDPKHIIMSRVESPGDLTTLFSENAGLWETRDAGATWSQLVKPGMNASGSRAIAFDPKDSKTIYYGTNNMQPSFGMNGQAVITDYFNKTGIIYKTSDAGNKWAELPTGAGHGFRAANLAVDPSNSNTLWLFPFKSDPNVQDLSKITQTGPMKSTDGGQTWTAMSDAFPTGYKTLVDGLLNPQDGQNAFVPTQTIQGMQKSFFTTDGGTTWSESNIYIYVAKFDTNDTTGNRMIGYNPYENGGGIYESKNKGKTWSLISKVPSEVNNSDKLGIRVEGFAMSKAAPGTIYMSGSAAQVWKSTDNGKSWKTVLTLEKVGGKNKDEQGSEISREQESGR